MSKIIYNEEENSIIAWKETDKGLYQLVFDEYNQVTYIFIGKNGEKLRNTFEFNFEDLKQIK